MTCGDEAEREEREAEEREAFGVTCDEFRSRVAHLRENDPAAFLHAIARLVGDCD